MKISFLICNVDNHIDIKKLNKFVSDKFDDYELVVAVGEKHRSVKIENVREYVFSENETNDDIINALVPVVFGQAMVVVRKIENNNFEPILNVLSGFEQNNDIVLIRKKQNKVTKFFKRILSFLIRFFYGYTLYDSNLSVCAFGEIPLNVLKQTENASTFTKINRWTGINIVYVEGECAKISFANHKPMRFVRLGIYTALAVASILLQVLIPAWFEFITLKMLAIFLVVAMVMFICVEIVIILVAHFVGKNSYRKANILKVLNQEKEPKATTAKTKKTKKVKENEDE
ncbi:MAG: hypothetical protein IJA69_02890 [Clostridia bacterium]|nr:hypothetical protein [Clostridia bacterium]